MKWIDPDPIEIPPSLVKAVGGHSLVVETLVRRGLGDPEAVRAFLDPDAYRPTPPETLPDLPKAVDRLVNAIKHKERILVWGDFDVDGQTATTLLVSGLSALGADVSFHIPIRESESHGIRLDRLKQVASDGYKILLTCDTGVTEHESVRFANESGMDVIITDHHELPPDLPPAYAIVNPQRLDEGHPLYDLPGVGTAYKLMERLFEWYGRQDETEGFLDLVALGIVADVATQRRDTRYLLQRGLHILRKTSRLGLQTMCELARIDPERLSEDDIGFAIAPRLNALGRLGDANPVVEFLTSDDPTRVQVLATRLEALNAKRKLEQDQVYEAARSQLERDPSLLGSHMVILEHPTWPGGLVGLVAGRLATELARPVILLATPEGRPARGSARSIEGVNITEALRANADLLARFGGHAGAAGFSLEQEMIPALRRALTGTITEMVGGALPEPSLAIDAYVPWGELSLELAEEIAHLAPFGPGNPTLTLASRGLQVQSQSVLGQTGEHMQLIVRDTDGVAHRVLRWRARGERVPDEHFDLAYSISVNYFRGEPSLQIVWQDARPTKMRAVELTRRMIQVFDYRGVDDPPAALAEILLQGSAEVWAEGIEDAPPYSTGRNSLSPADSLVVWTSPPSADVLIDVLDRVKPQRVYLLGISPEVRTPDAFLKQLAGIVKFALRHDKMVSISELTSRTGQTERAVKKGLAWLEAKGYLQAKEILPGEFEIGEGGLPKNNEAKKIEAQITDLIVEAAAYRRHLARAGVDKIIPREV